MKYTTLRERTIKRARRIRTLQRLAVWGLLVGFWVMVIRVFFVSALSHTRNTQGAQHEIHTRQIHRPTTHPAQGSV